MRPSPVTLRRAGGQPFFLRQKTGGRFKNADTFTYTVSDGELTATASVTVAKACGGGSKGGGGKGGGTKK